MPPYKLALSNTTSLHDMCNVVYVDNYTFKLHVLGPRLRNMTSTTGGHTDL